MTNKIENIDDKDALHESMEKKQIQSSENSSSPLASTASSILSLPLRAAVMLRIANNPMGLSEEDRIRFPPPLPFMAPAWSRRNDIAAAYIRPGNLEVMQWIAFVAMIIGNIGFMLPYWGFANVGSTGNLSGEGATGLVNVLRGIGAISFPMFSFVFAWSLASSLWSNPRYNFAGMSFNLICCALTAHIAWALTGGQTQFNIVLSLASALGIVFLLQEDSGWGIPLGLRLAASAVIGYWVNMKVDFGMQGLVLTLATYSYLRFNDLGARNTALAALFVMTARFNVHTAVLALPIVSFVNNKSWSTGKNFKSFFYVLYPLHIAALALISGLFFLS